MQDSSTDRLSSVPPTPLRRCQAKPVWNVTSSRKLAYITLVLGILNPKGYQNCTIGSKVTAILLNGGVWPIGGVTL